MATPIVSAAAAYVLMENKNYTPEQVKHELIATATPFKKSDCYNDRYGAGIVNFSNIINGSRSQAGHKLLDPHYRQLPQPLHPYLQVHLLQFQDHKYQMSN